MGDYIFALNPDILRSLVLKKSYTITALPLTKLAQYLGKLLVKIGLRVENVSLGTRIIHIPTQL